MAGGNKQPSYFRATRHPWACLIFLLPLLLIYETCLFLLGGHENLALRNGVDTWFRWVLDVYGFKPFLAAPGIIVMVFLVWSRSRWEDRPTEYVSLYCGMWFESVLFGFGVWAVGVNFSYLADLAGLPLANAVVVPANAVGQLITFVGAGIYEEFVFRLFLLTGLVAFLKYAFVPAWVATPLAVLGSAVLFALAHHLGPYGEPMDRYRFLYRTTMGVYFALLFWLRGFGIAVGTHTVYDVVVGVRID